MSATHPTLSVENLGVSYATPTGPFEVVRNVTFDIQRGEIFSVVGESGSGKSTMAQALLGLGRTQVTGKIHLSGQNVNALSRRERRKLLGERIAFISQDALSGLNPCTTVGYQIAEILTVHRGVSKRDAYKRAVELLSLTGISAPTERVHQYPHQFSGGMRQRALVAMAVALEPDVLVADEPTTALDATIKAQILQLFLELRARFGMAVIIITHDMGVVAKLADRMMVMYAGQTVEMGDVNKIFASPGHPYTQALLDAMPRLDRLNTKLRAIPGSPPLPKALPAGCAFHPRCFQAETLCTKQVPPWMSDRGLHGVSCHLPLQKGLQRDPA